MTSQPQPIKYTIQTANHTVVIAKESQLISYQGFPCIDGGSPMINGKSTRVIVRYDNKPELAAEINNWQAEWNTYRNAEAARVNAVAATIITDKQYNFTTAENDTFAWTQWDGTNGKQLLHKATGKSIYQMQWIGDNGKCTETVDAETKALAIDFWAALAILQAQKPARNDEPISTEPQHGQNGYCRKCHSYCYGDCQS